MKTTFKNMQRLTASYILWKIVPQGHNSVKVGLLDQTWLGVRCHPEWEFRPLSFSHSWTIQWPESAC